ncbi:MAG: hypothetical protein AAF340_13125 [Pseudomonadota bacterium]
MKGIRIPSAITVHSVGASNSETAPFVITNEATGQHFSADMKTVRFLDAIRQSGDVAAAAVRTGLPIDHATFLVQNFAKRGIVTGVDLGEDAKAPTGPLEGKLISFKADLANAAGLARRLSWIGRLAFSLPAAVIWGVLMLYTLSVFLTNSDKVTTSLKQLTSLQPGAVVGFVVLFVAVKAVHELGHVLAYRIMSLRENLDPGPIRVGIMVFAATPFPFTDVTGAWRISSRWRRAMIGGGGMYFEIYAVALLVLAWARFDLGSLEPLILQVAVFSGALTLLFNLNPAVKLDGYYILTDLFRQPNLVGRASQAARATVGRALGVPLPAPGRLELLYWVIAYCYRWTIFLGVFWLAYRFDPRLATLIAVVALMLLIVRPSIATVRPLMPKASRIRLGFATACGAGLIALSLVPFQARILAGGQVERFTTEYLFPPEAVRLIVSDGATQAITFERPSLQQDKIALQTRSTVLNNLARQSGLTGAEQAALANDRAGLEERLADIDQRVERLAPQIPRGATVSPLASERLAGQWIDTRQDMPLAAVSLPKPFALSLSLDQKRLEPGLQDRLQVRLVGAPECLFDAKLDAPWAEAVARDGKLEMLAHPSADLPICATSLRNGAAIVARFPLPPRSIARRLFLQASRLLQERLPFEAET